MFLGKGERRVNGQAQRRAACGVERQVGADVDAGQAHGGNGAQGEGAPGWAEVGKGGSAQGDGDARVPGQVPQAGRVAAAAVGIWKQVRWPGPAHHSLHEFGQRPGGGAAGEEPARQLAVPGQPRRTGGGGGGAERAELHDGPGGRWLRTAAGRAWHGRPGLPGGPYW